MLWVFAGLTPRLRAHLVVGTLCGPGEAQRPGDPSPELRITLLTALGQLDRVDRAVLVLRYWEDLDARTAAGLLGLTEANVRTRSVRALTRLRAVLGEDLLAH